jgi:APA family basic amino acid/polyamine antiporter
LESSFASNEETIIFKRSYTLIQLTLFGFGNIIGTGVFTLTGPASALAGNSVFISYMIGGVITLLTALTFAEFASEIPKNGSSYLYTYCMFGEMPAWMVAWS